jgi:signal transduction histidine kinase
MNRPELHRDKMAQLGELTVGIAHELNNSIGYVASNLGTLRRYSDALVRLIQRVETHLPPEARERWQADLAAARWEYITADLGDLIGETQAGADHLRQVVGDLKVLARASPSTEGCTVDACVEGALTVLAHQAKHLCQVERRLAAPRALVLVRSQIMQLAINLVLNAIQALPTTGGTIRVTTRDNGDLVTLMIEDSGPGVPPELRARIFEAYVTTKATGTGVGLALADQIAKSHGGSITVDRSPDLGGARFSVVLRGANSARSTTQAM